MQAISDQSLEELVECSICLETYTRPKVLPCQHTYCHECLLTVCDGQSTVTCPQCREVHNVASFKNNLFVSNLLSTLSATKQCCDCQVAAAVTKCEHCENQLCGQCLVQHTKLSFEISSFLDDLKNNVLNKERKYQVEEAQSKEECVINLQEEIARMEKLYEQTIQKLVDRRNLFKNFMEVIVNLYSSEDSYVDDLSSKFVNCKTINSLQDFKNNLVDMRTVTRLLHEQPDQFKFAGDAEAIQKLESYGRVEFGQSVLDIKGTHRFEPSATPDGDHEAQKNSTDVKTTKGEHTSKDSEAEDRAVCSGVCRDTKRKASSDVSTSTADSPEMECSRRDTSFPEHDSIREQHFNVACSTGASSLPNPSRYKQNQLPSNVDYTSKVNCSKTIIGHRGEGLTAPHNCCYHVTRDEIYVADHSNDRFMVYNSLGGNGRQFFSLSRPTDVAISENGELIFLLKHNELCIVTVTGTLVRKIDSFPLGLFKRCLSVRVYKKYVVVLDSDRECVIVFNEHGDYVRHTRSIYLENARSIAIAVNGDVYVTHSVFSRVNVVDWEGKFLRTFAQQDYHSDVDGVSVDGEGYVCVSRPLSHRVDVYDSTGGLVTSLGRPGEGVGCLKRPYGLCLMPDRRLVIVDSSNHRLQIF